MNKPTLATILLLAAHTASAEQKHVLVLRADGSADSAARSKIDVQVLKLAKNIDGKVEAGDISFTDAAAAVGCAPAEAPCRDEVMSTMGVDELVVTTVTGAGGELKISVKRYARSAAPRDAATTIPAGQVPDAKMNAEIGPLFGVVPPVAPPVDNPPPPTPAPQPVPAVATPAPMPPAPAPTPADAAAAHAQPARTAQADPNVTAAPDGQVLTTPEGQPGNHGLEIIGMAGGGGLLVLGLVMWSEASSTQNDINNAPTKTPTDFKNLQDLESTGDTYATLGNVFAIGGIALGAVSGYFYWRDHKAGRAQQARIAPTVFDHGAGVSFTLGGGR